jgi:putative phosphoesterase
VTFRIGIISDTHGLRRPEALQALAGVDHIIHAGDIGRADILPALREIAPVTAIRGNVDTADWARAIPETTQVTLAGRTLLVLHDLKTLARDPAAGAIDVVVSGHSHVARIAQDGPVLFINPGSAGPRRFRLPVTLATLDLAGDSLRPHIHRIET